MGKMLNRIKHRLLKHWGAEILTEGEKRHLAPYRYRKMEEYIESIGRSHHKKMDLMCAELLANGFSSSYTDE